MHHIHAERGVDQGCPLSPLLFVLRVDLFLVQLNETLPNATFRAFADGIGAVLPNAPLEWPLATQLFNDVCYFTKLKVNTKKHLHVERFFTKNQSECTKHTMGTTFLVTLPNDPNPWIW